MNNCYHKKLKCLNHYETFRKYLCEDCGNVFICECEKEIITKLFPHQGKSGTEYGTRNEFKVDGYSKVCAICNGKKEEPHPRAQIYNQKKKLDRYYWREIDLSYYHKILEYLEEQNTEIKDIFDFENKFPDLCKNLRSEARIYWRETHKTNPLYEYETINQNNFIKQNNIPFIELKGSKSKDGFWLSSKGEKLTSEDFVANYYKEKGYDVYSCERRIISTLIGAYLWTPINEPDSKLRICGIGSRGKLSKTLSSEFENGILWIQLPKDFGSNEFFIRKKEEFEEWLEIISKSGPLIEQYDYFLEVSKHLRDYLWVYNDSSEEITRKFLEIVPDEITFKILRWGIEHFWDRQPGWPDLFVVKNSEYFFVEVKGPNDKLSPDQIAWFKWVVDNKIFKCVICKIKKNHSNLLLSSLR